MSVEIKTVPDLQVIKRQRRLRIADVASAAADLGPEIDKAIATKELKSAGPWIFVFHGLPHDPHSLFDWEICRPVESQAASAMPDIDPLPSRRVAATMFEGPLSKIFIEGYAPLLATIAEKGLALSGESREVYHHWEGEPEQPAKIELQFALAEAPSSEERNPG
ncbi:hypothetical protein GCM10011415_15530 [Salipiger pallidus]|uniref:AraC effector-binding domain-containing protein n=1 Tax=Salipiger pallidus TaxID=1775170 RepID=A0A8J2ZIV8_9RHOB|nr:GyrI-like domain-containing protein [Salipiger pallidus]GGG69108.1 hypothetical protein GCM10011415_15530 [Salipiger pallidus]